ncbi:hypothetical protein N7461_003640 [Penicillium sp. DV-2018c]|nr:hypothetical protein N7461_003640 [Penicillium sp. DV-2018c]
MEKMVEDAASLHYDPRQNTAANEAGFDMLDQLRAMRANMSKLQQDMSAMEELRKKDASELEQLKADMAKQESHRHAHLDVRQRTISTWARDALGKDTERRKQETRRLNKTVVHAGDVRSDAMVVSERYRRTSTEWNSFKTLYGLTPDEVKQLDQRKYYLSLQALDRAASMLLDKGRTSLPDEEMRRERETIVTLLLEGKFDEANDASSTFLGGGNDSSDVQG